MIENSKFKETLSYIGIILGTVIIVVLGFYLFATAHPSAGGRTVIRWCVDPNPIRKEQIKLFESKNPGIHVINDTNADPQRLLTQIAGDVPPDVMAVYEPQILQLFARSNALLDLGPYVRQYNLPVDKLYSCLDPYIRYEGRIIGVPENCGPYVVFYNKKLFREAHLPYPKVDWTWDECLDAAKKLSRYETVGGQKVPVQKGLYISNTDWWFFVWMYGGSLFSPDGKRCTMDSPEVKKGIRYWADLRLKYHVMPTSSEAASMSPTGSWGGDALLFRSGKVAMMFSGRWMSIQYREQKDLDWDVVSVPHGPVRVTMLASKSYCVPKTSRNKAAAIAFIRNLLSKENQLLVANYGDGIPTLNDPTITEAFKYNPRYPNERNNALHLNEMKYARAPELSPYINRVDVSDIMSIELDNMWLSNQSPDEACDRIARRVNSIIRRNLANPNFLD